MRWDSFHWKQFIKMFVSHVSKNKTRKKISIKFLFHFIFHSRTFWCFEINIFFFSTLHGHRFLFFLFFFFYLIKVKNMKKWKVFSGRYRHNGIEYQFWKLHSMCVGAQKFTNWHSVYSPWGGKLISLGKLYDFYFVAGCLGNRKIDNGAQESECLWNSVEEGEWESEQVRMNNINIWIFLKKKKVLPICVLRTKKKERFETT